MTFATSCASERIECACVPTGTSDSLSNCLHIVCNVLTDRAARCSEVSVKFDPMLSITCFSNLFTCSL